ncbi:unnamed protein product, partial [Oppiella nova]
EAIPTSYDFKYSTGSEGPAQLFREEHRDHDGTVRGKYGYVDPNGKLRVVEYTAGANGYQVSGDIGPDSEVQNEAQQQYRSDPSVRAQTDAWSRSRTDTSGANYNRNPSAGGWSSVDPLWNVGALPQQPQAAPIQSVPQQPTQSQPLPRPVPQAPADRDRAWDDNKQQVWDKNNGNNWPNSDRGVSGGGSVDWNTWNSDQQTWTKPQKSNTGAQGWTSRIQHDWQQSQSPNRPTKQWTQRRQIESPPDQSWSPPSEGPTAGQWSQPPQHPTTGQFTQFRDNPISDQRSQTSPQIPPPAQWPQTTADDISRLQGPTPGAQQDVNSLREKWTGISSAGQWPSQPNWEQTPQQIAPTSGQWSPPPQTQTSGAQSIPAPPPISIADQWRQRSQQKSPQNQFIQTGGQSPDTGSQYNPFPAQGSPQWPQSPARVARIGDLAPPNQPNQPSQPSLQSQSAISGGQPPIPPFPNQAPPNWAQPIGQSNPSQFASTGAQNNWSQQTATQSANTGFQANTGPQRQTSQINDMFSGSPYVHFRIDHTVDPNQPPLRYHDYRGFPPETYAYYMAYGLDVKGAQGEDKQIHGYHLSLGVDIDNKYHTNGCYNTGNGGVFYNTGKPTPGSKGKYVTSTGQVLRNLVGGGQNTFPLGSIIARLFIYPRV